jgi:hypothetical protein
MSWPEAAVVMCFLTVGGVILLTLVAGMVAGGDKGDKDD